jgi:hypothetical protein
VADSNTASKRKLATRTGSFLWEQPERALTQQGEETTLGELAHELIIDFNLAVAGHVILSNDRGSCNDVPNQIKLRKHFCFYY